VATFDVLNAIMIVVVTFKTIISGAPLDVLGSISGACIFLVATFVYVLNNIMIVVVVDVWVASETHM
jgi:hypothetical protein